MNKAQNRKKFELGGFFGVGFWFIKEETTYIGGVRQDKN